VVCIPKAKKQECPLSLNYMRKILLILYSTINSSPGCYSQRLTSRINPKAHRAPAHSIDCEESTAK